MRSKGKGKTVKRVAEADKPGGEEFGESIHRMIIRVLRQLVERLARPERKR